MQGRDRLRKLAEELRTHGTFVGFGGSENLDPLMHEVAEAMESAADTIWDLHKKLVAANAEVRKERVENNKMMDLVAQMYRDMQGVLDMSTDTVFVDSISTLRDKMDWYMRVMAELGMPPMDYGNRMRELGMEVER
jgi:hypothetical protein